MRKKRYLWRVWLGFRLPLLVAAAARTPCFTQSAILPHAHTCANTGARADAPHLLSALVASSDPVFTKLTQIPFFIFLSREFFSVMEFCKLCENIYFHKCLSACMLICTCIPTGEFVCVCVRAYICTLGLARLFLYPNVILLLEGNFLWVHNVLVSASSE